MSRPACTSARVVSWLKGPLPVEAKHLIATRTETWRALLLILHDSAHPPTTPAPDRTPKGLCRN